MSSPLSDLKMSCDLQESPQGRRPYWLVIILLCACAFPALSLVMLRIEHSSLDSELSQVQSRFEGISTRLAAMEAQEKELIEQFTSAEQALRQSYRNWRSVDELPEIPTELIIFNTDGHGLGAKTIMTVPPGQHQLNLLLGVKQAPTAGSKEIVELESLERNYILVGPASYCLTLFQDSEDTPQADYLKIELTSNSAKFATIRDHSISSIEHPNTVSFGGLDSHARYPNEFSRDDRLNTKLRDQGVVVRQETWGTRRGNQQLEVNVTLRILSDGPTILAAHDFYPIQYESNYLGHGKYEYLPRSKPR